MDLCCLIDSEDQLPATALVNMLGDLFARGAPFPYFSKQLTDIPYRNKVPHQAAASCTNTYREALA